jgi:NAD dependent epimerase/dehydratase
MEAAGMNVSGERTLVTGAGGFIGSHLVELLVRRGARVRAMVHYNSRNDWGHLEHLAPDVRAAIEVRATDITDPFAVSQAAEGCGVVFHLAALIGIPYSYSAPASYVETNVRGTLNVLEAARRHGTARVVHTSTSEVYGTACYTPIDEAHPLQAQSPYSASKMSADHLAESYHRAFGVPVAVLRPFNTFGPRQSARAVIPTIVSQLARGARTLKLGNLTPVRDFTYVTDTARAFVAVAESDGAVGTVCNAGNGAGISVGDLVAKILGLMQVEAEVVSETDRLRPEKSEVFELIAGTERIRSLTGWAPEVGFEDGLRHVIEYVRAHTASYKTDAYVV